MHSPFSVDCIFLFVYLCICLCMCTLCVKVDYWPSGRTLWCELLTLMDHCASSCLDSYQISWNVIITIKLSFGKGCFVKFVTRDLPKSIRQGLCTNLTKSLSFGHQWHFRSRSSPSKMSCHAHSVCGFWSDFNFPIFNSVRPLSVPLLFWPLSCWLNDIAPECHLALTK